MNNKLRQRNRNSFMCAMMLAMPMLLVTPVYASYDVWLSPFASLVDTMISFMGIIGKALLAWAIFEVATALFAHDTSQMPQALRRIGAGTLLIFIQTIITAMTSGGTTTPPTTQQPVQTAMLIETVSSFIQEVL